MRVLVAICALMLALALLLGVRAFLGLSQPSGNLGPVKLAAATISCSGAYGCMTNMLWSEPVYNASGQVVSARAAGAPVIIECQFYSGGALYDVLGSSVEFGTQYVSDSGVWTGTSAQVARSCP